jgi:8-oxo-dGTP pyrophosphatase MutT (NUDIX family)
MNESVIFVLRSQDLILCEWRDFKGVKQNCLPGGAIEDLDRRHDDYVQAAAAREANEELGITVEPSQILGGFISDAVRFHVVLVSSWKGSIPALNQDNQNELKWVPLDRFIATLTIEPLKQIIEKLTKAPSPS